jgi:hypothetical protein
MFFFDSFAHARQVMTAYSKAAADAKLGPMPAGVVSDGERTWYRYIPELSIRPSAQKPVT